MSARIILVCDVNSVKNCLIWGYILCFTWLSQCNANRIESNRISNADSKLPMHTFGIMKREKRTFRIQFAVCMCIPRRISKENIHSNEPLARCSFAALQFLRFILFAIWSSECLVSGMFVCACFIFYRVFVVVVVVVVFVCFVVSLFFLPQCIYIMFCLCFCCRFCCVLFL